MSNAWTGGQYSVFRILFGIYLLVHFSYLAPWGGEVFSATGMIPNGSDSPLLYLFPNILIVFDSSVFVTGFILSAAVASLFFMTGYKDRIAAIWIWYVLACLLGRNPLIANPSLPYAGWMLLAHLFIPKAPYGSLEARGRAEPSGNWSMPKEVFLAAWIILSVSYSYSGYTKLLSPSWVAGDNISYVLNNPLARDYFLRDFFLWLPPICLKILTWTVLYVELIFAPLALIKILRPLLWLAMLIIQFGFAFLLNFPDLTAAMILFHIFTFNPAWIKSRKSIRSEILYYDGYCGLCHRVIRFLLAEDKEKIFKFSPLQGEYFQKIFPKDQRDNLPDSIVLITTDQRMLTRSTAVIYLLMHLGGMWVVMGVMLWMIPKYIRDAGYNVVGSIRYNLFKKTEETCPFISAELRDRFL
jgi:predicted DCC family thiol-disulfide oxidoreductase YuxK